MTTIRKKITVSFSTKCCLLPGPCILGQGPVHHCAARSYCYQPRWRGPELHPRSSPSAHFQPFSPHGSSVIPTHIALFWHSRAATRASPWLGCSRQHREGGSALLAAAPALGQEPLFGSIRSISSWKSASLLSPPPLQKQNVFGFAKLPAKFQIKSVLWLELSIEESKQETSPPRSMALCSTVIYRSNQIYTVGALRCPSLPSGFPSPEKGGEAWLGRWRQGKQPCATCHLARACPDPYTPKAACRGACIPATWSCI